RVVVWDAIDGLFPTYLDVHAFLTILGSASVSDRDGGGFRLEWEGPDLVKRLTNRSDLESLLSGLLKELGKPSRDIGHQLNAKEEALFPTVAACARRLLEQVSLDEAPLVSIDAALRLGMHRRHQSAFRTIEDVAVELHRSAERRRLSFWHAAD